jgi:hypothetical protein
LLTVATTGVALALVPPAPVNTALAVTTADPRTDGFQEQVAINGELALVGLFLQPGIITFRALNVTFAAALTVAVIVTALRYEAFAPIVRELKVNEVGIFAANMPKLYLVFKYPLTVFLSVSLSA